MEEDKPDVLRGSCVGGGSPRLAAKDPRLSAAQNGDPTQNDEAEGNARLRRRNSSANSEPLKAESRDGKGVTPPDEPPRKRFQIPRKNRDKKALQPISSDSREFEEILKILHSSCLEANSKIHFAYKSVRLVHNEFLEKEFTEKRRQLKFDGRQDKELAESYAFLLVDENQVHKICEKGLHVGHSKLTTLGKPSMGVYLSRYADLLQANPLESGTDGCIFIFKVIKGKMKSLYDNFRNNQDSATGNGSLDPAPKHECHVLKNMNAVTSLLSYRAFECTQYYFYEYGFGDILKRPRHVCPHAAVSFGYKIDQKPKPSISPFSGSVSTGSERNHGVFRSPDCSCFILWRGQLMSKGKLLCYASLKSTNGLFFPYKLPEKLDLEIVMRLEQIKKRIPHLLFFKETHRDLSKEVIKGGIHSRLYEVSDKTRTGSELQGLLQKLERENLALVKPLSDKGFLFFYFPTPMTSLYGTQSSKPYPLHALFIYPESRETQNHASHLEIKPTFTQDNEIIPELSTFIASMHYAFFKCQSDTSDDFNIVVEKHVRMYLKRRAEGSHHKEYVIRDYDQNLDCKKSLFAAPRNRSHVPAALNSYIHGKEAYSLPVQKAKELITENHRVQQFSPVSDYEPTDNNHEVPTTMNRELREHSDYDPDKVHGLINLIQIVKKSASQNPENDDASNSGLKRKLESNSEQQWKHRKLEDYRCSREDQDAMQAVHSVSSLISALGGQDTDLRQESPEPDLNAVDVENCKALLERLSGIGLLESIKMLTEKGANDEKTSENESSTLGTEVENSGPCQQSSYADQPCVEQQPNYLSLAPLSADSSFVQVAGSDHPLLREESILEPYSGCASPCPSTPTEQLYQQQHSSSSNVESEMHWKLIPITGEEGRVPEDHVGKLRDENPQGLGDMGEQPVYLPPKDALPNDPRVHYTKKRGSGYSPLEEYRRGRRRCSRYERGSSRDYITKKGPDFFKTEHSDNGVIESTVLEVYCNFMEHLQEVLKEKDILYTAVTKPLLSSDERVVRLSDRLYAQAFDISVQEYVDELRGKLDSVVSSYIGSRPVRTSSYSKEPESSLECVQQGENKSILLHHELGISFSNSDVGLHGKIGQNILQDGAFSGIDMLPHTSLDMVEQNQENTTSSQSNNIMPSDVRITDLINTMRPEVFNNLMKIFSHVNKNIVQFYIHEDQEGSIVCTEIKDYLLKLGNVQCFPEQFVQSNTASDKLLVIIQNEDIGSSIHKIPSLAILKRRPYVSFAGVDSLDDLKNHTYNELFVSGGFIVSDDTVLNPDMISVEKLNNFLMFLEQIDSPEAKWQWKIHCKFQKKLKELGRIKTTKALDILSLLNTYQKKHLVEILAYHNCDSQNRQAPELDCLIKLQVQNIQQRHLIFLTEKSASMFPSFPESGVVVVTMDEFMHNFTNLAGHHSSSNEESCLSQLVNKENQTAGGNETDVKEEEDMSLDSDSDTPQIEVCADTLVLQPCTDNTTKTSEPLQTETGEPKNKILLIESDYMQPVTPVSTSGSAAGDNIMTTAEELSSNFQDYHSTQLDISHFNLLTNQTFLGSMVYPVMSNQTPGENYFPKPYSQPAEQETSHQ